MNNAYRNNETISKRKVYIIGFILLVMVIGFAFYNTKDLITEGAIKKEELMNEYNLLQPLPGTLRTTLSSHNKSNSAIVSASYRSSKNYEEIKSFYMDEAKKNGWVFVNEETVSDWGRDFGGKSLHFRKGDYTLSIQYAGEKADYGWDFGVSLAWSYMK